MVQELVLYNECLERLEYVCRRKGEIPRKVDKVISKKNLVSR
jgi:hypothetical protein